MTRIYNCSDEFGDESTTLEIAEDGFLYDGIRYRWADISSIRRHDSFLWRCFLGLVPGPLTYIFLKDGRRLCITQNIRKVDTTSQKAGLSFLVWLGGKTSQDYKDIIKIFDMKTSKDHPRSPQGHPLEVASRDKSSP
jgi:hypothetical protein